MAGNTGFVKYSNLEQYYLDDNSSTGYVKINAFGDPNYIAPVYNVSICTPSPRYYNELRSVTTTKNDCGAGLSGTLVTLSAFPKQFVSLVSVADANNIADNWLNTYKQSHANLIGTCIAALQPITGCYYVAGTNTPTVNDTCAIYGTETYYNSTGGSGWSIGDTVYNSDGSIKS